MAVSFLVHPEESTFITPLRQRPTLVGIDGGRSAAAQRRRRVFVMRRLAVVAVALVLLASLGSVLSSAFAGGDVAPASTLTVYEVGAGDTMWSIAGSLDADADRREAVDLLADANGGTTVRPGQHLVIPAEVMQLVG